MLGEIEYSCLPGKFAVTDIAFISKCAELYSNHYGKWSSEGIHPHENIKLSKDRICEWLEDESVTIYYATDKEKLVGYAIALNRSEKNYGVVTWVTQLVVHRAYRHRGIAKNILFSIWGFSDHFAWGIVSANPYAVRALEKATRRRAKPIRIKRNAQKLKNIGSESVPYITQETKFKITDDQSVVNTEFFVDHSNTKEMLLNVTSDDLSWNLGALDEGWEWFAFTFKDQEQISLSNDEIENMVATSDSVVRQAYARMELDETKQKWLQNTKKEIDFIVEKTNLKKDDFVYDLGCGQGRHSIELAKIGIEVMGLDYITQNVDNANKKIAECGLLGIRIQEADCRYFRAERKAPVVICLYDVVGSFADDRENQKIIETAYELLEPGGLAIFSVMNYESTLKNAENTFIFEKEANQLLSLPASRTMEKSGNVFKSKYYIVDTETHLVYRKEQFLGGKQLPVELIVRDRRYTKEEIVNQCEKVGFSVLETKYTNATDWTKNYDATNSRAKEILLICKK